MPYSPLLGMSLVHSISHQTWRCMLLCAMKLPNSTNLNQLYLPSLFVTEARKQTADRTASAVVASVSRAPSDVNEKLGHTLSEPVASPSLKPGVPGLPISSVSPYLQRQLLLRATRAGLSCIQLASLALCSVVH